MSHDNSELNCQGTVRTVGEEVVTRHHGDVAASSLGTLPIRLGLFLVRLFVVQETGNRDCVTRGF